MNILIYRNQLLQEVTTGAYFYDISNSTTSTNRKPMGHNGSPE